MHRAKVSTEVAIVGASLAGSACAITLASHDIPVVVLDRSSFPRQKACGEGLSHLAGSLLRRLGIHPNLLGDSSQKLYGYRFASASGGFESFDPRCGLGMTHALMSGIAAAESIISALQAGDTAVQAHKRYEQQHEETAQSMRRYSCIIGSFIGAYLRYPQATIRAQRLLGGLSLKLLDQLGPSLETKQPEPLLASC